MGIRTRITRKGVPLKSVTINYRKRVDLTKAQVIALGIETQEKFRQIIKSRKKSSSQGKLENLIKVEYFVDGVSWGVGDIELLNKEHPGWKSVNYGHQGYTIRAKEGKMLRFKDKEGKIIYRKEIHNHKVSPMNFVERTAWWFKRRVLTLVKGVGR